MPMRKGSKSAIVFACCLLAMPTCVKLLDGFHAENMESALVMGALLGALHVAVRPILRMVSVPLGCLTLGLIQPLIDLALLYLCDHAVAGFSITSPLHAVIAVMLVNTISFIAAGRR